MDDISNLVRENEDLIKKLAERDYKIVDFEYRVEGLNKRFIELTSELNLLKLRTRDTVKVFRE